MLTVFGTGNATQVNTIVAAIDTALTEFNVVGQNTLSTLNLVVGIVVAMLVAMVLLGGIKRIGSVSEKLVPFMALLYVLLGLGVVVLNITRLPEVLASIVVGAFNPKAFTGVPSAVCSSACSAAFPAAFSPMRPASARVLSRMPAPIRKSL